MEALSSPDLDDFRYHSSTFLPGLPAEEARRLFALEARGHGLDLRTDVDGAGLIVSPDGAIRLDTSGKDPKLDVQARSPDVLAGLQEDILHHLEEISDHLAAGVVWSGMFSPGGPPPNFCKLTVVSVTRLNAIFSRLRLAGEGLDRFAGRSMHFRLLQPASAGGDFAFPVIGRRGETVWPSGLKSLHRPVYTVRRIDPNAGWLEFDVFVHEGGRTAQWISSLAAGDQVGITGPGGGEMPVAENFVMAGDETALPAVSRILEEMPPSAEGVVFLKVPDFSAILPLQHPAGVKLTWVVRSDGGPELLDLVKAVDLGQWDNPFLWFACEKAEVLAARAHFADRPDIPQTSRYIVAYWSASET